MNTKKHIIYAIFFIFLGVGFTGCSTQDELADGYGYFETDEVVVSSKVTGEILQLDIVEGESYPAGTIVGYIDTVQLHFQLLELEANRSATESQLASISAQQQILKSEKENVDRELKRVKELVKAGSATTQMQEDLEGKLNVITAQMRSVQSQIPAVQGQISGLEAKKMQISKMIRDSEVKMPFNGVILNKIAQAHEFTASGKPLFRLADLNQLTLRVYLSQVQVASITLGQKVTVKIDGENGEMMDYPGTISWVASEAEFTPKTIQTKETRVDLVYAVKVLVPNDGKLKLGMPGEIWF
jgi:HlyD family secretion protein